MRVKLIICVFQITYKFTGDNWVLRNFQRVRYTPLLPIVAGP